MFGKRAGVRGGGRGRWLRAPALVLNCPVYQPSSSPHHVCPIASFSQAVAGGAGFEHAAVSTLPLSTSASQLPVDGPNDIHLRRFRCRYKVISYKCQPLFFPRSLGSEVAVGFRGQGQREGPEPFHASRSRSSSPPWNATALRDAWPMLGAGDRSKVSPGLHISPSPAP